MQEVDGGILPIFAAAVIYGGQALGLYCGYLVTDILLNWSSYRDAIDSKLTSCK